MYPSAFGTTGCDEFGTTYKFTSSEINAFLPRKKSSNGLYYTTYPNTSEHIVLMKNFFNSSIWGKNAMVQNTIYERIYNSIIVYNKTTQAILNVSDEVLKSLGIDKIISKITDSSSLIYDYLKYLKQQKVL